MLASSAPVLRPSTVDAADLDRHFGAEIGAACWEEYRHKRLDAARAAALTERASMQWTALQRDAASVTIPARVLESVMRRAGGPVRAGGHRTRRRVLRRRRCAMRDSCATASPSSISQRMRACRYHERLPIEPSHDVHAQAQGGPASQPAGPARTDPRAASSRRHRAYRDAGAACSASPPRRRGAISTSSRRAAHCSERMAEGPAAR